MGLQIPMVMPIQVQRFAPKSNDLTRKNLRDRDGSLKFSRQNKICKVQNLFTPCIGSNECAQLTRRNQFRGMSVMHASICIGCPIWHHNTALQFLRNTWTNFLHWCIPPSPGSSPPSPSSIILWVTLLFPNVSTIPWTCIETCFQYFQLSFQMTIKSTLALW